MSHWIRLASLFILVAGVTAASAQQSPAAAGATGERSASPPLTVSLTPSTAFGPAATIRALVRVARDARNRLLRVVLDGDAFYRSSDIQLDGEAAPRSHFLEWTAVPPGRYCIEVIVFKSRGHDERIRRDYYVLGGGELSDTPTSGCMRTWAPSSAAVEPGQVTAAR